MTTATLRRAIEGLRRTCLTQCVEQAESSGLCACGALPWNDALDKVIALLDATPAAPREGERVARQDRIMKILRKAGYRTDQAADIATLVECEFAPAPALPSTDTPSEVMPSAHGHRSEPSSQQAMAGAAHLTNADSRAAAPAREPSANFCSNCGTDLRRPIRGISTHTCDPLPPIGTVIPVLAAALPSVPTHEGEGK